MARTLRRKQMRQLKRLGIRGRRKKLRRFNKTKGKSMVSLVTREPRFSCFPETLWTKMVMYHSQLYTEQIASQFYSYYLNSFGDGTAGGNGCGPQVNFGGAFGLNYPTGIIYLLASRNGGGGTTSALAPYFNYCVTHAKVMYRILPQCLQTLNHTPANYIETATLPYQFNNTPTALGFSTFMEQPECVTKLIGNPAGTGTGAQQGLVVNSIPQKWNVLNVSLPRLFGLTLSQYLSNNSYWGNANANLPGAGQAAVGIGVNGDGTNYYKPMVQVKIIYTVKFFNRNIMSSAGNQ